MQVPTSVGTEASNAVVVVTTGVTTCGVAKALSHLHLPSVEGTFGDHLPCRVRVHEQHSLASFLWIDTRRVSSCGRRDCRGRQRCLKRDQGCAGRKTRIAVHGVVVVVVVETNLGEDEGVDLCAVAGWTRAREHRLLDGGAVVVDVPPCQEVGVGACRKLAAPHQCGLPFWQGVVV